MRSLVLAVVSVCALAACNQNAPAGSTADAGGGLFPNLTTAQYRAEATINPEGGTPMPVVMIRSGNKLRMELATPAGPSIMLTDGDTHESYMISSMGGRQTALRINHEQSEVPDPTQAWQGELSASATRTGSCSVAGESGAEWTQNASGDGVVRTACVTNDGIILEAKEGDRITWQTTSVQRGPQAAELFTVPAGVQVIDMADMGAAMRDAMERAKAAQGH